VTLTFGLAGAFWIAVVPIWLAAAWRIRNALVLGLAGWLVLVPTWLSLVELQADRSQFLFVVGIVWVADTVAYVVGQRFGRRRLAPTISPGKTWEGVAGAGVAAAVYYALGYAAGITHGAAWTGGTGLAVVMLVTVMSIEGDLFESWIKRQAAVKDSGTLLPGHGGLLDRVDGLTASMPVAALLTYSLPAGP
jgi:phosphatidate cytidylyltransferase